MHRRQFIFNDAEKRKFRNLMRQLSEFTGVEIVTYAIMSNHFHILLEVPDKETMTPLTVDQILELLPLLYSKNSIKGVRQELVRADGNAQWTQEILDRFEKRRGRLDLFMKDFKRRFYPPFGQLCGVASPVF